MPRKPKAPWRRPRQRPPELEPPDKPAHLIPLSEPFLQGNEWTYIKTCLDTQWVSSAGSFVGQFEQTVAAYTRVPQAVAVNTGTSALHLALKAVGVAAGQGVLLPNLTFVASANAVRYLGATPFLVDVHPEHWQMDLELLARFLHAECELRAGRCMHLSSGTWLSTLMLVHVLGMADQPEAFVNLAREWKLTLVEDATEALGSRWQGKALGTFGKVGCLSFNGNKIITTGGGGMLLSSDEALAARARHLSTQAKVEGEAYFHDEVGHNYRMVNLLAAMGVAQMEQLPHILARKRALALRYRQAFGSHRFPKTAASLAPNHWLTTIRVAQRDRLLRKLREAGIQARPLWVPMNQLPMYRDCRYIQEKDVSAALHAHGVSLPSSAGLRPEQQDRVIDCVLKLL